MGKLWAIFSGMWANFVNSIIARNPDAVLAAAKNEFDSKMMGYNQALAQQAGQSKGLKMQIADEKIRAEALEKRVMANYNAKNLELAGSLARELQDLKNEMTTNQTQLDEIEKNYQLNMRNRKVVEKEFADKLRKLQNKLSTAKIEEAKAAAAKAISAVAFDSGDLGDMTKGLDEVLDKRIQKASGEARVATDTINVERIEASEEETAALEKDALASFLADKGIAASVAETPTAEREMGPATKV